MCLFVKKSQIILLLYLWFDVILHSMLIPHLYDPYYYQLAKSTLIDIEDMFQIN